MNRFVIALSVALIASAHGYSAGTSYKSHGSETGSGHYQLQGPGHNSDSASASASANSADNAAGYANVAPSTYGSNHNIPYQPANTRGNSITSSISYPNNKGEILIHRPAAIIVKRPPTKVVVNHPPLVVKPAPVVLHKPPAVVVRKVFIKHHPRPVKVEPVYVNVVKPPAEKYFVNEKQQVNAAGAPSFAPINVNPASFGPASAGASVSSAGGAGLSPSALSNAGVDSAAASAGYQLLHNNQGLAALANLSGSGYQGGYPSSYPTY